MGQVDEGFANFVPEGLWDGIEIPVSRINKLDMDRANEDYLPGGKIWR